MKTEIVEPYTMPNGKLGKLRVYRAKYGFGGWLIASAGNKLPVVTSYKGVEAETLAEALRNAKRFLNGVYGRSN